MAENPYETKREGRQRVEKKIADHKNLDELDESGLTELHKAVMNTDIYSIQKLLEAGAGINIKETRSEWTPLMLASDQHDYKIMEILLRNGASVNNVDINGRSALHITIGRGIGPGGDLVKQVQLLLDHGSSVNLKDNGGMSPVYAAIERGNPDILQLLIEKGGNLQSSFCGMGPIFILLMSDVYHYERCIDILLSVGVDINGTFDDDMYTPLMYAAALNRKGAVLHLLRRNADIKYTNKAYETALTMALDSLEDEEDNPDYRNVKLCFVAGGEPPSERYMEAHLPELTDKGPVPELKQLCRKTIRGHILHVSPPGNLFTYVPRLPLPSALITYLLYGMSLEDFPNETLDGYYERRLAQALT